MAKKAIGVDIGRIYTKVVVISKKEGFILEKAFLFKTPFLPEGDSGKIDEKKFFASLESNLGEDFFSDANLAVDLEQNSLVVIPLLLPLMPKKELLAAAQLEAERRMIAQAKDQNVFRYIIGRKIQLKKESKIEVTAIKTDKSSLDAMLELWRKIKVVPVFVAPAAAVISKAAEQTEDLESSDVAFVDVGAKATNVSIYRNKKLVFFRNIAYGLQEMIDALALSLGVSKEHTYQIIEKVDVLNAKEEDLKSGEESINPYALKILWQHNIERFIQELRRTLIYYKEASSGRRVSKFLFFGGGAQLKNLAPLVISQIGGSSTILNPFVALKNEAGIIMDDYHTPIFASAASLALQAAELWRDTPNFLPLSLQRKYLSRRKNLIVKLCLIIVVAGEVFFSLKLFSSFKVFSLRSKILVTKIDELKPRVKKIKEIQLRLKQTYDKISKIKSVVGKTPDVYPILLKMPYLLPQNLTLRKISFAPLAEEDSSANTNRRFIIRRMPEKKYYLQGEGTFFGTYESLEKSVSVFRSNLQESGFFESVEVTTQEPAQFSFYSYKEEGLAKVYFTQPKKRTFAFKAKLKKEKKIK